MAEHCFCASTANVTIDAFAAAARIWSVGHHFVMNRPFILVVSSCTPKKPVQYAGLDRSWPVASEPGSRCFRRDALSSEGNT